MKRFLFVALLIVTVLFTLAMGNVSALASYLYPIQVVLAATCGLIGAIQG